MWKDNKTYQTEFVIANFDKELSEEQKQLAESLIQRYDWYYIYIDDYAKLQKTKKENDHRKQTLEDLGCIYFAQSNNAVTNICIGDK